MLETLAIAALLSCVMIISQKLMLTWICNDLEHSDPKHD
jgi:hypothetical protein